MLLEERLSRQRGGSSHRVSAVQPDVADRRRTANYGIEGLPGEENHVRARGPVPAGRPGSGAGARDARLQQARSELAGARLTIARDYLDGRIDRAQAVRLAQQYQLMSPERAEQSIAFTDKYRSYVINYGLGQDLVRQYIDAAGTTPQARWSAMERILSEPTLPADLLVAPAQP